MTRRSFIAAWIAAMAPAGRLRYTVPAPSHEWLVAAVARQFGVLPSVAAQMLRGAK